MSTIGGDYQETKTVESVERATSSRNGNPAWVVHFTDGTSARTMSDSGWSYEAANRDNIGVPLDFTFTRGGRIRFARKARKVSA